MKILQIKAKNKKKEIFVVPNSVLTNLSELVKKRSDKINQFAKKNIITESEKFFDAPGKITERCNRKIIKRRI